MYDSFDARLACGLQNIEGPLDIRAHVGNRSVVRVWNSDKRGKMKDDARGFHCIVHGVPIRHIAGDNLELLLVCRMVEPSGGSVSSIVNKRPNLGTRLD